MELQTTSFAQYIDAGMVQEVPEEIYQDSDYTPAAVQACYADGKRYGVPIAVETNALFYNTEKMKEAPATWGRASRGGKR